MEISTFIAVVITGMIGGFFNTFVGAGSLLSIPVLMILGLPPHTAIATNRLGVIGSDIAGWYEFHVKKMIDYKAAVVLAVPALIGAVLGANLILQFDEANLRKIIGAVTFLILILIMANPRAGIEHIKYKAGGRRYLTAVIVSFIVGVYGGFYGAGAGTFLFYILILFFGETFLESAGTHEVANLSFSVTAALIFAYNGIIDYVWSVPLFIGSFAGSFISAYYSEKIGNVWLKRLFFAVVLAVVIKLFM
jgi:uncharacterized membrane protein YfcA